MQWKYKNVCDLIFTWCTFVSEHYFIETGGLTHRFLIQRQDTCKLELNNWSGHRVANLVKQQSTKYFIFCTNLMIPMSDKHIFIKSEFEWTKWKYNFTFVTNNFASTHLFGSTQTRPSRRIEQNHHVIYIANGIGNPWLCPWCMM